jgi:bifunctional DNase/RNase
MNRRILALSLAVLLSGCSPDLQPEPEVAVRVEAVAIDPHSNSPVLVLEEIEGPRRLPIWIGLSEARSIASALEKQSQPRPNTHDLAKRLIDQLEGKVERVVVTRLSDEIYYALIVVRAQGRTLEVDARPSDAIAIGLRYEAPLFVRETVFEHTVEGEPEAEPGREVRNIPPPDSPRSDRQVVSPRLRIQNTNASWQPLGRRPETPVWKRQAAARTDAVSL